LPAIPQPSNGSSILTTRVLFIGSDPSEWWDDRDKVVTALRAQLLEMKGKVQITPNDVVAYTEGDWGWAALNCTFSAGGNESPFRVSIVLSRRDDGWKIVQGHASAGVLNEDTVGVKLTT
jgi:hypothetical protein